MPLLFYFYFEDTKRRSASVFETSGNAHIGAVRFKNRSMPGSAPCGRRKIVRSLDKIDTVRRSLMIFDHSIAMLKH